jgi:hypothetical protein
LFIERGDFFLRGMCHGGKKFAVIRIIDGCA